MLRPVDESGLTSISLMPVIESIKHGGFGTLGNRGYFYPTAFDIFVKCPPPSYFLPQTAWFLITARSIASVFEH